MNESTVDLDKALNELQAYVDGFVKKNPRSKADRYFKELEKSIDKVRTVDYINHNMCIRPTQFCNILYKKSALQGIISKVWYVVQHLDTTFNFRQSKCSSFN